MLRFRLAAAHSEMNAFPFEFNFISAPYAVLEFLNRFKTIVFQSVASRKNSVHIVTSILFEFGDISVPIIFSVASMKMVVFPD